MSGEAQTATDPAHRLRQLLARPKASPAPQALPQGSLGAPWEGPAFSQTFTPEGEKQGPTQPERDHFLLGLEKSTKLNLRELIDRAGI